MKREVEREMRLPAFALQVGELELLWKRMQQLFDEGSSRRESIDFSLPKERLHFGSLDELRAYDQIRGRVTNFSLVISQGGSSVSVTTGGIFSNVPVLKVQGSSDIWCAGAVEAVMSVVLRNRLWYWWLIRAPLMLLFCFAALLPYLYSWVLSRELIMSRAAALGYGSVVLTLGFIAFSREKLLPPAALVFTNDLGFIRKYGAELGLALGLISLAASILMWLYPGAP